MTCNLNPTCMMKKDQNVDNQYLKNLNNGSSILGAVRLKRGREKTLLLGHPWIFSGGVDHFEGKNGSLCNVYGADSTHLGIGYVNTDSNIRVRMLGFQEKSSDQLLFRLLKKSIERRKALIIDSNAFRLVNGENDGLSGLIVDQYGSVLVIQSGTLGIDLLKEEIVAALKELVEVDAIYEKSTSISRKEEGLTSLCGWLFKEVNAPILVHENDIQFYVDVVQGQKTGFFLDQRGMREWIRPHVKGKTVLNLCAYTGGFSLHALKAGASRVVSVDISEEACRQMQVHTELNQLKNHEIVPLDVFEYLENCKDTFDLVILDPPAFVKAKKDLQRGMKAYRKLNRLALSKVKPNGLLMSSSCSYFMEESLFTTLLLEASLLEKREIKLLQRHLLAPDHMKSIAFREGEYLKTLVLLC
ncbi:MAG: class I SAM-dependent rRNA methyltransferase [Chlamydiia bacterium]